MQKAIFVLLFLGIISPSVKGQQDFEKEWKEVRYLIDRGLPQSALKVVDSIYTVSKAENNGPQFLKAALYQIRLRSDYQEDFMVNSIARMEQEIGTAQEPVKQVMHSILAELYWRYYQANRFKFLERTSLVTPDMADISTWDMAKLVETTASYYESSLYDIELLQQTALQPFDPILEKAEGSKEFRPTLFDFLAHRALDYFMNDEASLTRPADRFELDRPDYFLPAADFSKLTLATTDETSLKFRALQVMQKILAFHLADSDPKALIDADLKRLNFVWNNSILPNKQELYIGALKNLLESYASFPGSADARYELAQVYAIRGAQYDPFTEKQWQWELKKAKEICEEAIRRFPESRGAKNCGILLDRLVQSELQITLPGANVPSEPFLAGLSYKNADKVYFRIIRTNPEEFRNFRQNNREEDIIQHYLQITPESSWEQSLPDEGDFQMHHTQLRMPALDKGFYVLLGSSSAEFSHDQKPVFYSTFWVTRIGYVHNRATGGGTEIYVMDREKGSPLADVTAKTFVREYNYSTRSYTVKELNTYTSDKEGYISVPGGKENARSFYMKFFKGDDIFFTENYFYQRSDIKEPKPVDVTHFFTDRSIYRPGQSIYFKGILLEKEGDQHRIKPGESTLVQLFDVNNQKVSEMLLTTNEFGSFQGVFTAPAGVLTGQMQIRNESGRTTILVEEYKRPKFEVKIDPLEGNYRLDEMVRVTGEAKAYAGNPIDGAEVKYRVVRQTLFPFWRSWRDIWPQGESMEITSGIAVTDENGKFGIAFKAIPDRNIDSKTDPVFNYTVYIDVTDINGESHAAEQSVSVGSKSLYITTSIPNNLDVTGKNEYVLRTRNLNGQPLEATSSINIYRLVQPSMVLRERRWERPDVFVTDQKTFSKEFPNEVYDAEDDPETWQKGSTVYSSSMNTASDSLIRLDNLSSWEPGTYMIEIQSVDAFGEPVTMKQLIIAFNPSLDVMPVPEPFWINVLNPVAEPGETVTVLFGSAEKNARVLYEVVNKDKLVSRKWMEVDQEMTRLDIPVEEAYRGNFSIRLMFVRGNRSYSLQEFIKVPYTNKELDIRLETFRDKLDPGQQEEWRIRITGKNGDRVTAELLASMYDASLDVFLPNTWSFDLYRYVNNGPSWDGADAFNGLSAGRGIFKIRPHEAPEIISYDQLNWFGFNYYGGMGNLRDMRSKGMAVPGAVQFMTEEVAAMDGGEEIPEKPGYTEEKEQEETSPAEVPVRRNFEETAFFFPQMKTDDKGEILITFNVPESLTAWKFMGLAHTKDLKTGYIEKQAVTRKELMVMPNPPRFFREGDRILFSSKVVGMSDKTLTGSVKAEFFDAFTMKPVDELLGNQEGTKPFTVEPGKSQSFDWDIRVPVGLEAIVYRVVAVADEFSDGEEMAIPVLPNRMLVTETMPLPVNGKGTKSFSMDKLVNSGSSNTIKDYRLTLEFTSNPAWYAVQALPYLMEEESESANALFTRLYANSLATWIANSSPKVRQVFESWKNFSPAALLSNLQKNEELKSVILQETPWVLEATDETEQKRRIALLFDLNRMANEQFTAATRLMNMQLPNGGWPWYDGMKDSPYITQNIVTGIGKLQFLGVIHLANDPMSMNMARRAIQYMDARMEENYREIVKNSGDKVNEDHLSHLMVQYLYGRSFFRDLVPLEENYREAFAYFQGQAAKYWLSRNKYLQGMMAMALSRDGDSEVSLQIMKSLKENSLYNEELGMYWRDNNGYMWYELPVERQSLLIEAFSEVARDSESVERMKVWLLKQKQTQKWATGKATADAVYALLLQGADLLASDQLVEVTVGDEKIDPFRRDDAAVEAGTGYYKTSWAGESIKPAMGRVKVVKEDEGIAWGALYWQYFEDLDKITAAKTPLSLEKKLFREDNTPNGPVLNPVTDAKGLKTGDKVVVRIVLKVDRDMEFVHMKDMRAAAFEPVSFLSGYRYHGGLGYYEAPKDASVNFYFDHLRKGTYVFEYALVATQTGEFSNGITTIQCQYAPEFSAHSEGLRVEIQ